MSDRVVTDEEIEEIERRFDIIKKDLINSYKETHCGIEPFSFFENGGRLEYNIPLLKGETYTNLLQINGLLLLLQANYGARMKINVGKESDGISWGFENMWKKMVIDTKDLKGE